MSASGSTTALARSSGHGQISLAGDEIGQHATGGATAREAEFAVHGDNHRPQTLVVAAKKLRERGGELVLTGVRAGAFKVLDVCGLTSVFRSDDWVPSEPGAP